MKREKKEKTNKRVPKYKEIDTVKFKDIQMAIAVIMGIVFLILLVCAITNEVFVPAVLISFALFLFCICYYYLEDKSKKKLVYTLFILGVILIITEVVFTVVKIN